MSEGAPALRRQWVSMAGGSCDLRMGYDAIAQGGKVFLDSVGRAGRCLVVLRPDADGHEDERNETLRRELVGVGFSVSWHEVAPQGSCMLGPKDALALAAALERDHVTGDDLVVAVGDAELVSLASLVCDSWCGGTSLVVVPTNELGMLQGALIPMPLAAGDLAGVVSVRPCARRVLMDWDLMLSPLDSEDGRKTRALMVSSAMATNEREFSALWDRADEIMAGDVVAYTDQLVATAKSRGKTVSSTAIAVRQSLGYGQSFARALAPLTGAPLSLLMAEGMRFAARISVAQGRLDLDDMLAQDELLEALDLPTIGCDVAPHDFVDALKQEEFCRSNRFLPLIPHCIGRVRATSVEDDLLLEHAKAWCAARREV